MRIRILSLVCLALLASPVFAQNTITITNANIAAGDDFVLDVRLSNQSTLAGWQVVLRWTGDAIRCDSAVVDSGSFDPRYVAGMPPIDYDAQVINISLVPVTFPIPPIFPGEYVMGRLYFSSDPGALSQATYVDSAIHEFLPGNFMVTNMSTLDGKAILPEIIPGRVTIGTPGETELSVFPSRYDFVGTIGDFEPFARSLSVTSSTGAEVGWVVSWMSDWLQIDPSFGTTPGLPTVGYDLFGLDAGMYSDTIRIESDIATNTPLFVPVTLTVDSAAPPSVDYNFFLSQNRPNPFVTYSDPETEISYVLEETDRVDITIYNALGQRVRRLVSRTNVAPNDYVVMWDGRDEHGLTVPSGHYFYRMSTSRGAITKRMIVIK